MNTELFIAAKIIREGRGRSRVSRSIAGIAVFSIALGLAVMIASVAVITGFKKEITSKVVGFGSHVRIVNYDSNTSYETVPISSKQDFLTKLREEPGIKTVQVFATKAGIIKTKTDIQGVVLKGIGPDHDWGSFGDYLREGTLFSAGDSTPTNQVLISSSVASLLKLATGDKFLMYFVEDPPRMRVFTIAGIYETSLVEFDRIYVFCDIGHIRRLNGWDPDQVSGFEINLEDFANLGQMTQRVRDIVGYGLEEDGSRLRVMSIRQKYPQIFDWLNLQDMNVIIILLLMLLVSGFNMASGLLILILDQTSLIGVLKALGATNLNIRRIFLYQSGYLMAKGLFWGNVIGLSLCLVQKHFGIISLDPSSYYLTTVPINFSILHLLALNLGAGLLVLLMLLLPSALISRISPVRVLRFT